jgi:hypothetical protein
MQSVCARERRDEAIHSLRGKMDCFAYARNDGFWLIFLHRTIALPPPLLTGNGLWACFSVLVRPSGKKALGAARLARVPQKVSGRTHA